MAIVTIGTRRLYDALGVETMSPSEIIEKVDLVIGKTVALYLGPNPPLGVMSLEGSQYGIPGRQSLILHTNNEYKATCFLEISITSPQEITTQQLELLKEQDKETRESLLDETKAHPDLVENLLDAVSGILGLRVHKQLVLKPLIESSFLLGGPEPVSSFTGPVMEMLEGLEINSSAASHLGNLLRGLENTQKDVLRKGGAVLHWLLKAWRERDPTSRFMYLFIPLEAILPSTQELAEESQKNLDSLASLVKSSGVSNTESLLQFLERARTKYGPTLNSRFEEFARKTAIPGWELDVKAFKKYNRMRNLLLHAGEKNVRSHINFAENTRTLEDLVERYVSVALLGSPDVYQSRWRPKRRPAT